MIAIFVKKAARTFMRAAEVIYLCFSDYLTHETSTR